MEGVHRYFPHCSDEVSFTQFVSRLLLRGRSPAATAQDRRSGGIVGALAASPMATFDGQNVFTCRHDDFRAGSIPALRQAASVMAKR